MSDINLLLLWKQIFFKHYIYNVSHSYHAIQGQNNSVTFAELRLISPECACFVLEYLSETEMNTQITELKHTRVTKSWERKFGIRKLYPHISTFLQLWPPIAPGGLRTQFLNTFGSALLFVAGRMTLTKR